MKFRQVNVTKVANGWRLDFSRTVNCDPTTWDDDYHQMIAKTREGVFEFLDKYLVNTRPEV